ncbi:type II toxin-antitoxin system Phd/YefM family antitoxin [Couchioplanes caeruleus]|uniref:Uncharacterized protein n=2 Tax=Couchioplanes caeruleus TaxID=56438 RepID=A0A1K0FEB6_9ACTN|nr:hypothetical protein [Couchioplanes caeruleus]OJF11080.1 hypothetical protein BG844_28465 [Couchioplanes caeruleus subsp. caeruleus]ROP33703.1 hypothetical protein EDD30_6737 [Couchioplanes caeruleus]
MTCVDHADEVLRYAQLNGGFLSYPTRTVRGMSREIIEQLTAAAAAAADMLRESEAGADRARGLLNALAAAHSTAVRALPPDTSVREIRRYRGADGREMVELEVEIDDDLVAFLDTLPDPNAFIVEALRRVANRSVLGRHAYHQRLSAATKEVGLSVGWGADLEMWLEHYPDPPRRITPELLTTHAQWLRQRRRGGGEMDETDYLLSSPANAERLRRSIEDLNAGRGITFDSVEDMIQAAEQQRGEHDSVPVLQCLVCGETLQDNGTSDEPPRPSDGVMVTIPGNYGSTVYDPPGDRHLVAYLCDPCLTAKGQDQIILEAEVIRRNPQLTTTRWQPERGE